MSEPFIGEIRMMPYSFIQEGWLPCNGGIYSVSEFPALYSIVGDTFGGNGNTTFGVPDLRGRVPVHAGNTFHWGWSAGYNRVPLGQHNLPEHTHDFRVSGQAADTGTPSGTASLAVADQAVYAAHTGGTSDRVAMQTGAIGSAGGTAPHENMQPYQAMGFFIAHDGFYPPRQS